MNETIAEYIENISQPWQLEICQQLNKIIHEAIPDVEERIQYRKPHYLKNGKYACVMGTAKGWVSFTIFNTGSLDVPDGFFEASDVTERRTIKILEGQAVDYAFLTSFIQQAASSI